MTDHMLRYEFCASLLQQPLLQQPLISDGSRFTCALRPDGAVQMFDGYAAQSPLGCVLANGVGQHCRWLMTSNALVVVRQDGTFQAKPPPSGREPSGGDAYRTAFSFAAPNADLIVISADEVTHVVRVTAGGMDEHTLPVGVRCLCGVPSAEGGYTLFGQTPRTPDGDPGAARAVLVSEDRFRVEPVAVDAGASLECVAAAWSASGLTLLLGALTPAELQMQDVGRSSTPLRSDHDAYRVFSSSGTAGSGLLARIDQCRFIAAGGPLGGERAYFQRHLSSRTPRTWATLLSVDGAGILREHELTGLMAASSVHQVQFDPLVGWIGIAALHDRQRTPRLLMSRDGESWSAVAVEGGSVTAALT
jgi:hypothetical protein